MVDMVQSTSSTKNPFVANAFIPKNVRAVRHMCLVRVVSLLFRRCAQKDVNTVKPSVLVPDTYFLNCYRSSDFETHTPSMVFMEHQLLARCSRLPRTTARTKLSPSSCGLKITQNGGHSSNISTGVPPPSAISGDRRRRSSDSFSLALW